jgi:hypothetical protein
MLGHGRRRWGSESEADSADQAKKADSSGARPWPDEIRLILHSLFDLGGHDPQDA